MTVLPFLLLAVLAGMWYLSAKIMQATVETLANPMDRITPRTHVPAEDDLRQPYRAVGNWALEHGFEEDVMFDFRIAAKDQSLFCRTWRSAADRTYLVFYYGLGRHFLELVTIYDDKTGVTTTNAPDAHTLPAVPGAFIQSFPPAGLDELLALHERGCRTLERRTGLEPQERRESTLELITASLQRQARYVTSIPGWQWKGLWWMTVRKRQMIGKDIGWQLDRFGVHEPATPNPEILQ